ncbi:MAG: phosphate transport system permease protein, partial [Gammaproteobacteria bacterium]
MNNTEIVKAGLQKRYAREKRFQFYGKAAVMSGFVFLIFLLFDIITKAIPAFNITEILLDIPMDRGTLELSTDKNVSIDEAALASIDYAGLVKKALRSQFPEATKRKDKKQLYRLMSGSAEFELSRLVSDNPGLIGGEPLSIWFKADDDIDTFYKFERVTSRIKNIQVEFIESLKAQSRIRMALNWDFFRNGDSREPEQAGIKGALLGSFWTLLVTLLVSLPVGIAAAIYLEEFAPQNRLTDFIEININNLAAVPSIVFGLLGLAVFINFFGMPRSVPLVGGLVLSLMTLPTIIISSRAAIKSVPPSLREAALGLGASHMQTVFHHVLPQAMPGVLTGAIIGMAQALGE